MDSNYLWHITPLSIQVALQDDNINELNCNADGQLWVTSNTQEKHFVGTISNTQINRFVQVIAHYHNLILNHESPTLDVKLPAGGERMNVTLSPVSEAVSFSIRKHVHSSVSLNDLQQCGVCSLEKARAINKAIRRRKNILISGGPGAGKTTLTNALLNEVAECEPVGHRLLLLEDVAELICPVPNYKRMLISQDISMQQLLKIALRNSPDRIIIGEVRDSAALDMLKAWNVGCPGGIATIHANSAHAALQRVIDLCREDNKAPPYTLAGEVIDLVIHIQQDSSSCAGRKITELLEVSHYDSEQNKYKTTLLTEGQAA